MSTWGTCGLLDAIRVCFCQNTSEHGGEAGVRGSRGTFVALNPSEIQSLQLPPQTTATLYEGCCPEAWLEGRVQDILESNPWVAGVLKTNPKDGKLALWFPDQPNWTKHFQVIKVEDAPSLLRTSLDFTVKVGSEVANTAQPLCQITAITEPTRQRWILQMSMSHAVADSHTFYAIHGMLDARSDVCPMEFERVEFNPLTCLKAPLHWKWLFFSCCRLLWLLNPWPKRNEKPVIELRYVKEGWLQRWKSQHDPDLDAPHVSANDLLASWFFSVTQPACGFIPINMRDRMPGLGVQHAGLYTTMLIFYPEEYKRAANIRRAVTRLCPACMPDASRQAPGRGSCCGAVTAWHMFYRDVNLPGCKQLSHFPVTSVWKDYPAMRCPFALIFRPEADRLAMCTVTGAKLPEDPEGPLGDLLGHAGLEVLDLW